MAGSSSDFDLTYTGAHNPRPGDRNADGKELYPYIPDDELKESVRLAIALNRPLLVMGDPGCGKTRLASAIAYELTQRNLSKLKRLKSLEKKEWPLYTWYIKSTSRARDGLYTYDAVARLRDAQLASSGYLSKGGIENLNDPEQKAYIKYGPLGKAFQSPLRAVVLIDEIDKAEIDFPNDLLLELDEQRFFVEEVQKEIPAKPTPPPIIIITSNNERPLPDAFLRRCIFHYVDAPDEMALTKILEAHFADRLPKALTPKILASYLEARGVSESAGGKQVGTSELLDWVEALLIKPETIGSKLEEGLPYKGLLFKTPQEKIRYQRQQEQSSESK
ncbi:MAG: MoxR family ATPase [Elainellaceae cyanobacterium]